MPGDGSDYLDIAPGPLNIDLSNLLPFNVFRAKLHSEILSATHRVAKQLELLGHTVVTGNPDHSHQLSWDFLARSTSGLVDWQEQLGYSVVWTAAPLPIRAQAMYSGKSFCAAHANTKTLTSVASVRSSISTTSSWCPPPRNHHNWHEPSTDWTLLAPIVPGSPRVR